MMIPKITGDIQTIAKKIAKKVTISAPKPNLAKKTYKISPDNFKANFLPYKGKASRISRAFIIHDADCNLPLLATKLNNSYLIDFDSQTEVMYGIDAIKYLKKTSKFEHDTQVIFPKKTTGVAHINGKDVVLGENSGIMINAGTKAQIDTSSGYPMLVLSKKDYDWYERYGKDTSNNNTRNLYDELIYRNSHPYNGSFSPNKLLSNRFTDESFLASIGIDKNASRNYLLNDIYYRRDLLGEEDRRTIEHLKRLVDNLKAKGLMEEREEGFIRAVRGYNSQYFTKVLQDEGFSQDEINLLIPIFKEARQAKMESFYARKNSASDYPSDILERMRKSGILHDNKKDADINVYWKYHCANEQDLRRTLQEKGFSYQEQDLIVTNWRKANLTGYDLSGLKFLDENVAVYNLDDKRNNWTRGRTDWVTNSTALSSSSGDAPFVGVSMVRNEGIEPKTMAEVRGGQEVLHSHPNLEEKRQTEVYLPTSGKAILITKKGDEMVETLVKEGEMVVIGPGVSHCISAVSGNYEQVVLQLPSAFHYGLNFKQIENLPDGYTMEALERSGLEKLRQKENGNI